MDSVSNLAHFYSFMYFCHPREVIKTTLEYVSVIYDGIGTGRHLSVQPLEGRKGRRKPQEAASVEFLSPNHSIRMTVLTLTEQILAPAHNTPGFPGIFVDLEGPGGSQSHLCEGPIPLCSQCLLPHPTP